MTYDTKMYYLTVIYCIRDMIMIEPDNRRLYVYLLYFGKHFPAASNRFYRLYRRFYLHLSTGQHMYAVHYLDV